MTDVTGMATTAEGILETLMRFEPMAATIIGAVVPGAAPVMMAVQPEIALIMPGIEKALTDVGTGHPENLIGTLVEFLQHIMPGQPNSPILSSTPETVAQ